MSPEASDRDEQMRELVRAGMTERTSAAHDAAVLSAARAFAETPQPAPALNPVGRTRRVVWAVAASIGALALAFVFAWQIVQDQRELAVVNAEKEQLARLVARLEERIAVLERKSENLTEALTRAQQVGAVAADAAASGVARVLATIALAPGAVRGEEEAAVVQVPPGAGTIRLQLDLGTVAQHDAFRVAIATTAGKEVWSSGPLRARGAGARRTLSVEAPAQTLDAGAYEVALRADGSSEDLTYYYFDVVRR